MRAHLYHKIDEINRKSFLTHPLGTFFLRAGMVFIFLAYFFHDIYGFVVNFSGWGTRHRVRRRHRASSHAPFAKLTWPPARASRSTPAPYSPPARSRGKAPSCAPPAGTRRTPWKVNAPAGSKWFDSGSSAGGVVVLP